MHSLRERKGKVCPNQRVVALCQWIWHRAPDLDCRSHACQRAELELRWQSTPGCYRIAAQMEQVKQRLLHTDQLCWYLVGRRGGSAAGGVPERREYETMDTAADTFPPCRHTASNTRGDHANSGASAREDLPEWCLQYAFVLGGESPGKDMQSGRWKMMKDLHAHDMLIRSMRLHHLALQLLG